MTGFVAWRPVKTPVFLRCSRSSVGRAAAMRAYDSTASSSLNCCTSGDSGAITKNVAPKSVSGRVVKTGMSMSSSSTRKRISAPSERPIQLVWIFFVRSGQSIVARSSSSASAYAVILKNHCAMFRASTTAPQRQQRPSTTCSFASTV